MGFDYAAKIQALIANAENEALSDAARAAYRTKAEELMVKYRIEQEQLIATDALGAKPIKHDIKMPAWSEMSAWHSAIIRTVANHTGCRYTFDHTRGREGVYAVLVGYEGDVRYAEFLWTAALLTFSTRVDPAWDENRTREENIFFLRNAGIERRRIATMAGLDGSEAKNRTLVQRIYLKECARRGEEARATGLGHQTSTYREAYARSFVETLRRRLSDARDAVDAVAGGVVLAGREDRVDDAFYTFFPHLRPSTDPVKVTPCDKCKPDRPCRLHRWTKADEVRYQRRTNSPSARAGAASGQAAASDILITRGHDRADRLDTGATLELM